MKFLRNPFKKKEPAFTSDDCTAIWIDDVGSILLRVFKIIEKKEGLATISFNFPANTEIYKIKEKYIRRRRVVIYKTSEGKIIVQNPDGWRDIDLKGYGIKEFRFNLQNFSFQESKAANRRWTLPPDLISKLSPLFKILLIAIAVGVIGWAAFKFAAIVLAKVLSSRTLDCSIVLPKIIGAINSTIGTNIPVPMG